MNSEQVTTPLTGVTAESAFFDFETTNLDLQRLKGLKQVYRGEAQVLIAECPACAKPATTIPRII